MSFTFGQTFFLRFPFACMWLWDGLADPVEFFLFFFAIVPLFFHAFFNEFPR